jgi:hypothetical protein
LVGVSQWIKEKQGSGGNHGTFNNFNAQDTNAENYLVLLLHRDNEFYCVRGTQKHLRLNNEPGRGRVRCLWRLIHAGVMINLPSST